MLAYLFPNLNTMKSVDAHWPLTTTWLLNAACHICPRTICRSINSTRLAPPSPFYNTKRPSVLAL